MTMTFINFTPHEIFQTKQIIEINEMDLLHLTNGSFGYKYHNPQYLYDMQIWTKSSQILHHWMMGGHGLISFKP
jgi:hypothetical protein